MRWAVLVRVWKTGVPAYTCFERFQRDSIENNPQTIFCYILPNNLAAFCLCLENFTEELKNSALICLVEKVSRQFHIRPRHCSVLVHIYKKKKQERCKMYSSLRKGARVSLKL